MSEQSIDSRAGDPAAVRRRRGAGLRRRLVVAASVLLLPIGLVGCGIPDQTDVMVDGRGPAADPGYSGGTGPPAPIREESGDDPAQFAINFLASAAGEAGEAYKRVNDYIVWDKRFKEKPANEVAINVVRFTEETPEVTLNGDGTYSVKVPVQQVGVLRANGSVGEPVATEKSYTFTIGPEPRQAERLEPSKGLYVLKPPPVLLLSTEALETYYQARTIYFWNADRNALVPDLRYLPKVVPVQRQATEMLGWLTGGPSDWLSFTAVRLPEGAAVMGNVPAPKYGGRVEINLTVKAGEVDTEHELDQLFNQLAWSLLDYELLKNELELKIQNQSRKIANAAAYRRDNPVYRVTGRPVRYCVYAAAVRACAGTAARVPIAPEFNRGIISAGLARQDDRTRVALVSGAGKGRKLLVGNGIPLASTFHVSQSFATMGRPVWLKGADPENPVGLVVADGRLYRFDARAAPVEVPIPNGKVTAMGASLDGHRIAFIAGGVLHVAALTVDDGAVNIGPARRLATSLRELSAVDWTGENTLALAGSNPAGRATIFQLSVDGVSESPLVNSGGGAPITHLAAFPANPVDRVSSGSVLYEANEVAYSAGEPIGPEQVVLEAASPTPGTQGNPTAPFYLY